MVLYFVKFDFYDTMDIIGYFKEEKEAEKYVATHKTDYKYSHGHLYFERCKLKELKNE